MAKKHNFTKAELLNMRSDAKKIILATSKAHMICTLAVLIDEYEFTPDEVNNFIELYNEFLQSYDKGDENFDLLNENIYEYCGVRIN